MVKSNGDLRLDRQIALIVGAITMGLLARDVVPDLLPGDAGEFHFAAWQWGLAHPTGYPVYLLAGGAWQRVLAMFGISPAFALNLLSALFLGIAAALFYWLLIGWLPGSTVVRRAAALLAVAFFVVNPTVRSQGLLAEVYTLHALFIVAILLAAQRVAMPAADLSQARAGGWLTVMTLLLGLSLAHHATTLLLVPPLVVYLFLANRTWWRSMRAWLWAVPAFLLPLLFYLYVPLRSGAEASPWYHQRLGNGVLTLYDGTWNAFANFVTGRSISVGFYRPGEAMAALPAVFTLWLRHFEWPGFLLIVVGLFVLVRVRNWPVLTLTVGYLVTQQTFNLFYAIDDIFVYYVPLYLLACIWVGYAAAGIGMGFRLRPETAAAAPPEDNVRWPLAFVVILFWLPLQMWNQYSPLMTQLRAESEQARTTWEAILAAQPPEDAILVSNDRNEIVPLFYLQSIEGRALKNTGLFPLIAPDERFRDIGVTLQTALDDGGGQPVYLIKSMAGLEARFALAPGTEPLVEVLGSAATQPPAVAVGQAYGPLYLVGYDWVLTPDELRVDLQWRVDEILEDDYTTTVQLFDGSGEKIGQDDRQPGGVFYPTSLWKTGERLLDSHVISVAEGVQPERLLVGMYAGPDAVLLAPPLELPFPAPSTKAEPDSNG